MAVPILGGGGSDWLNCTVWPAWPHPNPFNSPGTRQQLITMGIHGTSGNRAISFSIPSELLLLVSHCSTVL